MGGVEEALIIFIVKRKLKQHQEADRPSPGEQNGLFGLKKRLSGGVPKLIPSTLSIQMVRMAFLFLAGHRAVCISLRVTMSRVAMSSFLSGMGRHSHLPPQVHTLPLSCLRRRGHSVEC